MATGDLFPTWATHSGCATGTYAVPGRARVRDCPLGGWWILQRDLPTGHRGAVYLEIAATGPMRAWCRCGCATAGPLVAHHADRVAIERERKNDAPQWEPSDGAGDCLGPVGGA